MKHHCPGSVKILKLMGQSNRDADIAMMSSIITKKKTIISLIILSFNI